jgi:hypothetical protein
MGGVSPKTKEEIHKEAGPKLTGNCIACGICVRVCPADALSVNDTVIINMERCWGCGRCVKICPKKALSYRKEKFGYLLAEAANTLLDKISRKLYITVLMGITELCDCGNDPGFPKCPDIGILVSDDPVAIDKAAIDLIKKENPKFFTDMDLDPNDQVIAAEGLGMGQSEYRLKVIGGKK